MQTVKIDWKLEALTCASDPYYFISRHVHIHDATAGAWVPFTLWPKQAEVLDAFQREQLVLCLKSRQIGLSWLGIAYITWQLLFRPNTAALILSRRDEEASFFLTFRIQGILAHIPPELPVPTLTTANAHRFEFSNGSYAIALSDAADSYSASTVLIDEGDLVDDLEKMLLSAKPTVDNGGKLFVISRVDKSKPASTFKRLFLAATAHKNNWYPIFLPWNARPDRTPQWYAQQKADFESRGNIDGLYEQYPESVQQALSPRIVSKRIPPTFLESTYDEMEPDMNDEMMPDMNYVREVVIKLLKIKREIPSLEVYIAPKEGHTYVLGCDPGEGVHDNSAIEVVDIDNNNEEVACFAQPVEPSLFGSIISSIAKFYNGARALIERNNTGFATLAWMRDNDPNYTEVINGEDGQPGWRTTAKSKVEMYAKVVAAMDPRQPNCTLHARATYLELASIDANTLSAPPGLYDDRATAWGLAIVASEIVAYYYNDPNNFGGVHL